MMQKGHILLLLSCYHLVLNTVSEVHLNEESTSVIRASSATLPQHEQETSEPSLRSLTASLSQPIDLQNLSLSKNSRYFHHQDSRRSQITLSESTNCHDLPSYRNPLIPILTCQNWNQRVAVTR